MRAWAVRAAAVILLVWCVATALDAVARARALNGDDRARLDAELQHLAALLPARGTVGYVDAQRGPSTDMGLRIAQYALAPRLVTSGTGPEWLVVRTDVLSSIPASPLAEYDLVDDSTGSHRVYRRR